MASRNPSSALLDHLARLARARAEAALEREGLRPRHLVALTLLRDHDGFSQQSLATTLQMDGTNLVGLLNDLEGEGFVARQRDPEDRRRHLVEITPAGTRKLGKAEDALAGVEDEVFGVLSQSERQTLYRLLRRATSEHVVDCSGPAREWAASPPVAST